MLPNPDTLVTCGGYLRPKLLAWSIGIIVIACCATAQAGFDTEKAFEAAYYREVVMGDPAGAIGQYRTLLEQSHADRATAAKALLQIGLCQEKLGQRKAAYATWTRVTS